MAISVGIKIKTPNCLESCETTFLSRSVGVSGVSVAAGPHILGPPACKQSAGELLKPVQPAIPHQLVMLTTAVTRVTL